MRLLNELHRRLREIPGDQAAVVEVSDDRLGIDLHLSDWNRLGCLLEGLALERRCVRVAEAITADLVAGVCELDGGAE